METNEESTFKTTWSRLETALNLEESYSFTENRPKTSASIQKSVRVFQTPQKTHILRTTSACKSCRTHLKRTDPLTSRQITSIPGLTFPQVQLIYKAKCCDLEIPVLPDQEKRFFLFCFKNFQNRVLQMRESGLGLTSARAIGEILKSSSYFAYVQLSKNLLKDEGVIKIAKSLLGSLVVVHLDVSSNEVSPEGASIFFQILNNHHSLASIDISSHEGLHRNRLCTLGSQAAAQLLKTSHVLSVLNLAGTCIGAEGLDYIVEGLGQNVSLSALNLANNALGFKAVEKLARNVVKTDLRDLNLACNKITSEGCEALGLMLSGGFEGFCVLEKLDLGENEIGSEGLGKIFAALRINNQLKVLNLKKNSFKYGLSANLYQCLSENITLKSLDLSHCCISCEGLVGFSEGLGKNNGLVALVLSSNRIGDKGAEYLSMGLARNKCLLSLDLSTNVIKDKGALALAKALQENSSIHEVYLKNNGIKDVSAAKFSEVTRWKKNILKLALQLNPCNFKYLDVIKSNLKSNKQHQKQKLIPELHSNVEKLQFRESAFQELQTKIAQKEKEKTDLDTKVKVTGGKLEEIKVGEEVKLSELKKEYESVREVSLKLSHEIEDMHFQLDVWIRQKKKFQGEKIVTELCEKIEKIQGELKEMFEKRKSYSGIQVKEQIIMKTSRNNEVIQHLTSTLQNEQSAKKVAEGGIAILKKKLEEKKNLIEGIKNPRASNKQLGKVFLASEKLASSKKKTSVSPLKPRQDLTPKLFIQRGKSLTKRVKTNS